MFHLSQGFVSVKCHLTISVLSGHEEDLQGGSEVSGVETKTQPGAEAVDVSGAERAAAHQPGRTDPAARRLSGEHR